MPTFHAYCRVSSEKQRDNNSDATQDDALRKFHGYKYPELKWMDYNDPAISSEKPWFHRPDGERLWTNAMPGDVIAVATFDRAFRSLEDLCQSLDKLTERKVTLHCLDLPVDVGTIEGQAFFKIYAVIKELERKTTAKRIKAVNAWKRENGKPVGTQRPPGYKAAGRGKDRKFVPWPDERRFGYYLLSLERQGMSAPKIYHHVSTLRRKGKLVIADKLRSSYGYYNRLRVAARNKFPLPDGTTMPGTIEEFMQAEIDSVPA